MGLVNYGSDSETESLPAAPLPPKPIKRKKGPVRILLEAPQPLAPVEPPKKKPKFTLGSGSAHGLSAMLPPPKHESTKLKLEKVFGDGKGDEVVEKPASFGFVPHTIAKGKKLAEVTVSQDFFGLGELIFYKSDQL